MQKWTPERVKPAGLRVAAKKGQHSFTRLSNRLSSQQQQKAAKQHNKEAASKKHRKLLSALLCSHAVCEPASSSRRSQPQAAGSHSSLISHWEVSRRLRGQREHCANLHPAPTPAPWPPPPAFFQCLLLLLPLPAPSCGAPAGLLHPRDITPLFLHLFDET